MSVAAIDWVLAHSRTTGSDRLVLISLANHSSGEPHEGAWESWPGVSLIGQEAGLRRDRATTEAIGRLVAQGAIERHLNAAPDGRMAANRRTNLYRILLSGGMQCGRSRCSWCGPEVGGRPEGGQKQGGQKGGDKPTTKDPTPTPKPLAPPGPEGRPTAPQDLTLQPTPTKTERKQATAPEARPHSATADRLARAEWERLPTKPVAGFLALRARVEEALDAGYTEAQLERALPTIKAFTRNGFDLALRDTAPTQPQHDPSLDGGRELPSGEVHL